jgi:nucleoside 2-deoxyribosyltransferase
MTKVLLIGSLSPAGLKNFRATKKLLELKGYTVYPTEEVLGKVTEDIRNSIKAEYERKRFEFVRMFYTWMKEADVVLVCNDEVSIGIGTAVDIGVALALGKKLEFQRLPLDPTLYTIYIHGVENLLEVIR